MNNPTKEELEFLEKYYDIVGNGVAQLKLDEALKSEKFINSVKKLSEANLHMIGDEDEI